MGHPPGTRRRGLDSVGVRILLGLGFVMAVAASLFVVFADEAKWLRLAVLLGLWAALLAAFAVAKSRRDARSAELRQEEMTRIYELELQREVSARREYEAQLAETTRAELETRHNDELAALREQVERLTSVLSGFFDGDLMVERLTLSAEATRVRAVGDAGAMTAIGPMARQLVEGRVGPGPFDPHRPGGEGSSQDRSAAEPVWGPQPPPIRGPFPAGPSSGADLRADALAGAVTEQIPRIVEPGPEPPVIDARPQSPRVVGVPPTEILDGRPDLGVDRDVVDPGSEATAVPSQPAEAGAGVALEADDAGPVDGANVDGPIVDGAVVDGPIVVEPDYLEIEHGATQPESESEEPESESEEPESESEEPESESGAAGTEPGADADGSGAGQGARPTSAAPVRFTPAADVPDAPTRGDAPATAWTLRHRLDTPAAPVRPSTPTGRRAARMAAASAAQEVPSEAVAEVSTGTHETSGHTSGVTVAELLAAYGGSVPPRRRRHVDDD